MSSCSCGHERRQFWLWKDSNGELHASRFAPSTGMVRAVYATTARDALWAASDHQPKHDVTDVDDGSQVWAGRCALASQAAPSAAL